MLTKAPSAIGEKRMGQLIFIWRKGQQGKLYWEGDIRAGQLRMIMTLFVREKKVIDILGEGPE